MNQGLPGKISASDQSETWTRCNFLMGISFLQFLEIIVFSFHINVMETNLKLVILGVKEHSLLKRSHNVTLEQKK